MSSWDDDSDEGMFGGDRGFLVGKQAALADYQHRKEEREFKKLVASLSARRWAQNNREHVNAWHRENNKRPERKANTARWKRERSARVRAIPIACKHCRRKFLRGKAGRKPAYCSRDCGKAARRLRRRVPAATCPCGRPMTGRRKTCRSCAQRARRQTERTTGATDGR